ncbi:MAG: putative mycofactocin biosynthesis glycosyltransferase MftF [Calditrichaeota bacterium]|nr:putative mycofactocin biosynthesis glycosyltransferase MftF [Calditrichota bacterium]
MQVSVLIPYRDGATTLAETVAAFAGVSRTADVELEVVIVADGDEPPELPAAAAPVRVFAQQPRGQSAATNRAAREARGDLLWLAAQDVIPERDALVQLFARHAPGRLVQGRIEHDPRHLDDRFTRYIAEDSPFQFDFAAIDDPDELGASHHFAPHALVERERLITIGGYDELLPYGFQDTDFALRWLRTGGRIVYAEQSLVRHNHAFTFDGYFERQRALGRSAVRFFRKWRREAELARFARFVDEYLTRGVADLEQAERVVELWRDRREIPALHGDAPGGARDALDASFYLLLRAAFYRGVADEMMKTGLAPLLQDTAVEGNPYQWIVESARRG